MVHALELVHVRRATQLSFDEWLLLVLSGEVIITSGNVVHRQNSNNIVATNYFIINYITHQYYV